MKQRINTICRRIAELKAIGDTISTDPILRVAILQSSIEHVDDEA